MIRTYQLAQCELDVLVESYKTLSVCYERIKAVLPSDSPPILVDMSKALGGLNLILGDYV
jgi:hypothetical protein